MGVLADGRFRDHDGDAKVVGERGRQLLEVWGEADALHIGHLMGLYGGRREEAYGLGLRSSKGWRGQLQGLGAGGPCIGCGG